MIGKKRVTLGRALRFARMAEQSLNDPELRDGPGLEYDAWASADQTVRILEKALEDLA